MNKYNAPWEFIQKNSSPSMKLSFDELHKTAGLEIGSKRASLILYKKKLLFILTKINLMHILAIYQIILM